MLKRPERERRKILTWISVTLAALVLLVYGQVVQHAFVSMDDRPYVSENPHVRQGLTGEGVAWAFTTTAEGNYHPLTWISHMLDVDLFGLDPGWHHLTSVLLHAANAVLLLLALVLMTGRIWPSALVAALFALHPLRVESVAWIAERKDVLSGLFFMLALLAYGAYVRRPGRDRYVLLLLVFALGLMAKPMLVTLPLVLLLLDLWPLGRFRFPGLPGRGLVLEKLPLLALSAASSLVTVLFQRRTGAVLPFESVGLLARIANALVSYVVYLGKTVWPVRLAVLYPHPALVAPGSLRTLVLEGVLAGAALALTTAGVLLASRRRPFLAVGWLWFLLMLLPVIGLVQVGAQSRADRYAYLPLIGIYLSVAWGLEEALARWPTRKALLQTGVALALAALALLTYLQVGTWKDSSTLYRHALAVTDSNYTIHNNLGSVLPENSPESAAEYRQAIAIKPDFPGARYNLGVYLQSQGDLAGARAEYEQALLGKPDWREARINLALVLEGLGDKAAAERVWQEMIRLAPGMGRSHYELGKLLAAGGELPRAVAELELAVRLEPREALYQAALAGARQKQGSLAGAAKSFEEAARADPDNVAAQFNLGVVAMREGRLADAERQFEQLLRVRPDEPQLHNALAAALAQQGKYKEAEAEFEKALELNPEFEKAREGLDKVRRLLARGR